MLSSSLDGMRSVQQPWRGRHRSHFLELAAEAFKCLVYAEARIASDSGFDKWI